jgi:uncharacterized protein (DUF58 family)
MKQESFRLQPTGLWILFGPVLACMWLAAVNFSNNLVYAILYLIGSLSFISLFHTWKNLAALRVEHVRIQPAFAGEEVRLEIHLRNSGKHPIYGIFFARLGDEAGVSRWSTPLQKAGGGATRLAGSDSCSVEVAFSSNRRGLYRFESLVVKSSYPFGLFWASFRVPAGMEYFVYPQAKGNSAWPAMRGSGDQGSPSTLRPGDDFHGVRAYLPGESLRHVDWKAFARGRPLAIKQFTGGAGPELWLDAADMQKMPLEARLSQLALWVVSAEKAEVPYALKLGRILLPLGLGAAHSRRALEALAVAGMRPA